MTFDTEDYDVDGYHSTASNTGRMTIPTGKGGVQFRITGLVGMAGSATANIRELNILLNGATRLATERRSANGTNYVFNFVSTTYVLADGDYVELQIWHNNGSNLATYREALVSPIFSLERLA